MLSINLQKLGHDIHTGPEELRQQHQDHASPLQPEILRFRPPLRPSRSGFILCLRLCLRPRRRLQQWSLSVVQIRRENSPAFWLLCGRTRFVGVRGSHFAIKKRRSSSGQNQLRFKTAEDHMSRLPYLLRIHIPMSVRASLLL